jgi:hypothetical protein
MSVPDNSLSRFLLDKVNCGYGYRAFLMPESTNFFPKRFENLTKNLNENAKCQPWIIKIWLKKPNLDERVLKYNEN